MNLWIKSVIVLIVTNVFTGFVLKRANGEETVEIESCPGEWKAYYDQFVSCVYQRWFPAPKKDDAIWENRKFCYYANYYCDFYDFAESYCNVSDVYRTGIKEKQNEWIMNGKQKGFDPNDENCIPLSVSLPQNCSEYKYCIPLEKSPDMATQTPDQTTSPTKKTSANTIMRWVLLVEVVLAVPLTIGVWFANERRRRVHSSEVLSTVNEETIQTTDSSKELETGLSKLNAIQN